MHTIHGKRYELFQDKQGFYNFSISTMKPIRVGQILKGINKWNSQQLSESYKIKLHPFAGEDPIVTFSNDDSYSDHHIIKRIVEAKENEDPTYTLWHVNGAIRAEQEIKKKLDIDMSYKGGVVEGKRKRSITEFYAPRVEKRRMGDKEAAKILAVMHCGRVPRVQEARLAPQVAQEVPLAPQEALLAPQVAQEVPLAPQEALLAPQAAQGAPLAPQEALLAPQVAQEVPLAPQEAPLAPQEAPQAQVVSVSIVDPDATTKFWLKELRESHADTIKAKDETIKAINESLVNTLKAKDETIHLLHMILRH